MVNQLSSDIQADIEIISRISVINNLLEVACVSTGMGFSAVARVTDTKWVACATNDKINFGLEPGDELKLESTICHEIREHRRVVAIDHVATDPVWYDHHTPSIYGLQSYISVPIILKNGDFFGTLCAIDTKPAPVNNDNIINTFVLFADLISFHLDALMSISESEKQLKTAIDEAEVREQFIAMLGHDLRNPVNAISNAVQLQLRSQLDERNQRLAKIIQDATMRTRGLIDNILDFASGRLGGGIKLNFDNDDPIDVTLQEVVTELTLAYPDHDIRSGFSINKPLKVDHKRIAQLFSNLLGNAISHGKESAPILITADLQNGGFVLSVTNQGNQIPDEALKHLFKPFKRGNIHSGQEGLGLGLFIASEIAKAHHGTISVDSTHERTTFTLTLPDVLYS